jgi:two-component system, cell cycle sensor histidine kinase and response regulator CckA
MGADVGQVVRLLVVAGDEESARWVRALEDAGINVDVRHAQEGAAGAEAIARRGWDLVLLAHDPPVHDALAVLAAAPGWLEVPVIALTGAHGEGQALELVKAGAADVAPEGQLDRLVFAVRAALERAGRQRGFLSLALRAAAAGTFEWDLKTNSLRWSEEMLGLYGFGPGEFDGAFETWADCLLPDDREVDVDSARESARTGLVNRQFRIRRRDTGAVRWVEARGRVIRDDAGRPVRMAGINVDITQRKVAEEAVLNWQRAFEATGLGIAVADARTGILRTVNQAFAEQRGYTREEMAGRTVESLFTAAALPEALRNIRRADETGHAAFDTRHLRRDGSSFPVLVDLTSIRDESGVPASRVAHVQDITERRAAEDALRESEATLRLALSVSNTGVWELDLATKAVTWSPETLEIMGVKDFAGTFEAFTSQVHPDDLPPILGTPIPPAGGGFASEFRVIRPNGEIRWIFNYGTFRCGEDGRPTRLLGTVQDITERKRAAQSLMESEQRYRDITLSIGDAIYEVDAGGRYLHVSDKMPALLGYAPAEMEGRSFFEFAEAGEPDEGRSVFDKREAFRDLEIWRLAKDGRRVCLEVTGVPRFNASGGFAGFLGTLSDVTARIAESKERESLSAQLQQAQKLESIGRLAGGIAHDFNNLLTVMNGYSDLALRDLHASDPLRPMLVEIRQAGERASQLTHQLLAFSRKQVSAPRPVDVDALIAESQNMLRRLIGEDVELVAQLGAGGAMVHADPGQLHQVLMNLVVNARDAMPKGGRLTIETGCLDAGLAELGPEAGEAAGACVRITVADTGSGMDDETKKRIFDPFFTTKAEGRGTGLGLSMVYGIVRQSGGAVTVDSVPGGGATFSIYLPVHGETGDAGSAATGAAQELRGGETILLVEDQEEVRLFAESALRSYGYRVISAASAAEALQIVEICAGQINLVLTDVVMPRMNGKALADRVKERIPEMPVLFMSGYAGETIDDQVSEEECIQKPFTPAGLARKIRGALAPSRLRGSVLVVDDDESVRKLFERVLAGAGFSVLTAEGGEEALRMLEQVRVDLVVTDLVMPEGEGIETIRAIRKSPGAPKIIAVSGAFGGAYLAVASLMGAHGALKKPVSPDELLAAVNEALGAGGPSASM